MIVIVRDSTAGVRSQILEEIEVWGQEIPLLKTISLSKQSFAPQLGSLTISYEAAGEVMLTAEVLTRSGQHVAGLIKDEPVSGLGTVQWDGKDKNGEYASAGIYILRLTAKNETQVCIRTAGVDLIREGPPPPQIVTNFPTTVNRPEITLTATSSPGLSLKVSLNGEVVGQYSADAQGLCVFTVANLQAGQMKSQFLLWMGQAVKVNSSFSHNHIRSASCSRPSYCESSRICSSCGRCANYILLGRGYVAGDTDKEIR